MESVFLEAAVEKMISATLSTVAVPKNLSILSIIRFWRS